MGGPGPSGGREGDYTDAICCTGGVRRDGTSRWLGYWLACRTGLARIEHFHAAATEERELAARPNIFDRRSRGRRSAASNRNDSHPQCSGYGRCWYARADGCIHGRDCPRRCGASRFASPKPVSSLAEVGTVDSMPIKMETADPESPETPVALASVPAPEVLIDGPRHSHPQQRAMRSLASLFTSDRLKQDALLTCARLNARRMPPPRNQSLHRRLPLDDL